MTRVLYVDAAHGISSGALLGALVDLGVAPSPVLHAIGSLPIPFSLRFETETDGVRVLAERAPGSDAAQPVTTVRDLVDAARDLPGNVREGTKAVYERLAEAQPDAPLPLWNDEEDTILHVAGALHALADVDADRILAGPVDIGQDTPDPAVVELLGDRADALGFDAPGAPTTPLGAALLCELVPEAAFGTPEPRWRTHPMRGRGLRATGEGVTVSVGTIVA